MATTFVDYTGDGNATKSFSFPSYKVEDIKVDVDGVIKTVSTHYNISSYTTTGGGNVIFTSGNIPASPAAIRIFRDTDVDTAKSTYTAGSSIKAGDLNNNQTQLLYAAQEEQNQTILSSNIKDGAIKTVDIGADQITNALIADDQIDSEHYVDGSIDTQHIADSQITSVKILDGTIVNADVNASAAIAGTKVAPDFGSQNVVTTGTAATGALTVTGTIAVSSTVDGRDVAADGTKLDTIETSATADQTNAEIKTAYEANADTNEFSDAEQSKLAGIETAATIDQTAAEIKTLLQSDKLELSEMNTTSLDSRYYTETEAEAKFLRQDSSETIASGVSWSNSDAFVATTAAINARILDLVDDVGGFTAIASEQHFPNTNPQGTTGQAAILSIQTASTTLTPSGTTVTISNGNLANNANITITGVSAAIPTGFGFLVESTSTLHTYSFHRLVPKATEVTTVAGIATAISTAATNVADINNFADLYIISSSAPTQRADGTSLQEGDLWYDSSNDNLLVYTGSAFAIITPSQSVLDDVAIVSGVITYAEDLGLITASATTGSSNGSLDIVADALEDEITFTVTAATGKFIIDGVDKPALTLYKGWTYTFDLSDASNASHPFRFSSGGSAYSTNVTVTGTQGQAGAKIAIKIPESQPTSFIYYCTNHSGMGNSITVKDDPIKTVSDNITNINTTAGSITNVNTTAGSISNVNTVSSSIADVNRYANEYQISASAPGSPSNGDLWFDTANNTLKNYNGSAWLGITSNSGIGSLADDSSPQLGAALDGQNNNMSNIGTIDGTNLQLDFGSIA